MARVSHFLRCVGRAVVKNAARGLASLVPLGETVFEIARDAHEDYRRDRGEADLRADLDGLARSIPAEVHQAVEKAAAQEGGKQPADVPLVSYLDPVPASALASAAEGRPTDEGEPADRLDSAPPATVTSPKRTYTLLRPLGGGDVADVHLAAAAESYYALKVSRVPGGHTLLANERHALTDLLTRAGDTTYRKYLPTLAESFPAKGRFQKRVNVFLYEPGFYTLEQVHERHPALDGRHLAWVFKRLLTVLGFSHGQGIVHGAVLPCHVLLHAANHGLHLIGWGQSIETGGQITTIPTRYRDWYPPEVLKKQPASPAADVFLAARCLTYLAGGDPVADRMPDAVPAPMQRFLKTCLLEGAKMRPEAWKLLDEFDDLLHRLYGPPKFHELTMP
jgi:serine/threonine protein kinase